jgi:hypothetical protein
MKTTRKINKLKQNGPKNVAAVVKFDESNYTYIHWFGGWINSIGG